MQLDREWADTRPDPQLMADVAKAGGGAVLEKPEEARAFMEKHRIEIQAEATPYSEPLWSRSWALAALLALLTSEWFLRRIAKV
jgi:hypothetical protein